jgi:hypothetical protein
LPAPDAEGMPHVTDHLPDDALAAWAKRHGLVPVRTHAGDQREAARTLLADSLAQLGEHILAQTTRSGTNAGEPLVEAALTAIMTAAQRRDAGEGNER